MAVARRVAERRPRSAGRIGVRSPAARVARGRHARRSLHPPRLLAAASRSAAASSSIRSRLCVRGSGGAGRRRAIRAASTPRPRGPRTPRMEAAASWWPKRAATALPLALLTSPVRVSHRRIVAATMDRWSGAEQRGRCRRRAGRAADARAARARACSRRSPLYHRGRAACRRACRARKLRERAVLAGGPAAVFERVLERPGPRPAWSRAIAWRWPAHRVALSPADRERRRAHRADASRDAGLRPPDLAALGRRAGSAARRGRSRGKLLLRQRVLVQRRHAASSTSSALAAPEGGCHRTQGAAGDQPATLDVAAFKDRFGVTREVRDPPARVPGSRTRDQAGRRYARDPARREPISVVAASSRPCWRP